jgi:L-threonylcarbamoyladenylate synthase
MVDLTGGDPVLLREGAVSRHAVAEVLGVPAESLA